MLLSEDHLAVQDAVRAYVQAEIAPHAAAWDKAHHFPAEQLQGLAQHRALGPGVSERMQERRTAQPGSHHQPLAAAESGIGVDAPAPIGSVRASFQLQDVSRLSEQAMAAAVVEQGLHGRQRVDLAVLRREQRSGRCSGQCRCQVLQVSPVEQPQWQSLVLALLGQPGLSEPFLFVAGQLQQARAPRDRMASLIQQLPPLAPERQGLLPQPPATAAAAPEDLGHQQTEGSAAPGLAGLAMGQGRIDQPNVMAVLTEQPGHRKAHHTGADHGDRRGPAGGLWRSDRDGRRIRPASDQPAPEQAAPGRRDRSRWPP